MNDMFRRAEMRWMSVEDADITVSARELAEFGRSHSALLAELATLRDERDAAVKQRDAMLTALSAEEPPDHVFQRLHGLPEIGGPDRRYKVAEDEVRRLSDHLLWIGSVQATGKRAAELMRGRAVIALSGHPRRRPND